MATVIQKKRNKVGGIMLPNRKLCYKAIVIKQHGAGIKINLHLYSQYWAEEANIYDELKIVYSINGDGKIGPICAEK